MKVTIEIDEEFNLTAWLFVLFLWVYILGSLTVLVSPRGLALLLYVMIVVWLFYLAHRIAKMIYRGVVK